ncbi:MAG: alanine--tRNA ligase, partial [Nitrospira sp.]|nr:alanine--tRNA ligase [Nitrospira sp.]
KDKSAELKEISELLKTDKAYTRVEKLVSDIRILEKEIETIKGKTAAKDSMSILKHVKKINGITVLSHRIDGIELKDLRILADNLRDRVGSGIIFIASTKDGQASMVAMVTKDLTERFNAGKILKEVAAIAGGSGGGKPEMAQGGTKDIEKLDTAIESVYEIVQKQTKS